MKIKHFSLVGQDYRQLRDFYQDLLDLKLDFDDQKNEYCQFSLDQRVKIDFESQKVVDAELPDLKKRIKLLIRVETDNVDRIYQAIKKKYQPLTKPMDRPWKMRNFYLLDPVDNLIEFYQKL